MAAGPSSAPGKSRVPRVNELPLVKLEVRDKYSCNYLTIMFWYSRVYKIMGKEGFQVSISIFLFVFFLLFLFFFILPDLQSVYLFPSFQFPIFLGLCLSVNACRL